MKKDYTVKEAPKQTLTNKKYPMTLQGYLLGLKTSTAFSFFAWTGVVTYVDPESAGRMGDVLFLITLFVWVAGVWALLVIELERRWMGDEYAALGLGRSLRRGILLACVLAAVLLLRSLGFLTLWSVLLTMIPILLIELRCVHTASRGRKDDPLHQSSRDRSYGRIKHTGLI